MNETPDELFFRGALALSLGLIIGFQRERKGSTLAGIRTFPFFALMGFFSASLEIHNIQWIVGIALLSTTIILARGMGFSSQDPKQSGVTTEIAGLMVFILGAAFRVLDNTAFVVVAGGICALLLHLKQTMHAWVERLNRKEVHGIMQFVLIAFVILPLLPDKTIDQFGVINPRHCWMMVVLITGISLVSFSVQKIMGTRLGSIWTGILGGLVSSTATTVTLSKTSASNFESAHLVGAIVIASTAAFIRILGEILIVTPGTFMSLALPLTTLFLVMGVFSALTFLKHRHQTVENPPELGNPSELKAALIFGVLFAVILYVSAWVRESYGHSGSFIVSLISGLIDVDAIVLTTAQLIENGSIKSSEGWRLIMTAFLSNLAFKSLLVIFLAKGIVRTQVTLVFLLSIIAGVLIMNLWP